MQNIFTIGDIDPSKLIEVIYNRDPETSSRFSLPVPNWLDETGNPLFLHPNLALTYINENKERVRVPEGLILAPEVPVEWRFGFHNSEDTSDQWVKINGSGTVMFTAPTPGQVVALRKIISELQDNVGAITPNDLHTIMVQAYNKLGLIDVYNDNRSDVIKNMDLVDAVGDDPAFGNFVYKPKVSTCLPLAGSGELRGGPTATPQIFENGGFIFFKGLRIEQVRSAIKIHDPDNPDPEIKPKIVSKAVFLRSRRNLDGSPINLAITPQQDKPLRRYYKPKPISGFPEWTPEVRDVERKWLSAIAEIFEQYGFVNIETPAVEEMEVLAAKGEEVDKEIYGLTRVQAGQETSQELKVGLHYDLTVPMARYVAQHFSDLVFPFKRYQMQKVWRGDRPQRGRFREFYQCDIDVVDKGQVSLEFDAELPMIIHSLVKKLAIGNVVIGLSNRKILQGFYQGLGIESDEIVQVIRAVDKLGRIGEEGVKSLLTEVVKLAEDVADKCIALASIKETEASVTQRVLSLGISTPLLLEGLKELDYVMERLSALPKGSVIVDLSIARGLDYYTGTVYEGKFADYPNYPVILAGGRYDNLVSSFMSQSLPGVGISFGLTRVFSKLLQEDLLPLGKTSPTQVLVVVPEVSLRDAARSLVDDLRSRGIPSEVYHEPERLASQLEYADRKHIPFVLFPNELSPDEPELKDMRTGKQFRMQSVHSWYPSLGDGSNS